ncbi:MAG: hypothetical protein H6Q60_1131 [Oscillospiraceae bacterium]|nr:hypothetical protein [Oscillospiraceae bacterium]
MENHQPKHEDAVPEAQPKQFSSPDTPPPDKVPYTPASPQKRIWAWVGVVYMIIIILLFNYQLSHGKMILGITGIMLAPAIGGFAAQFAYLFIKNKNLSTRLAMLLLILLCAAAIVICLLQGISALLSNLSGGG